MAIVYPNRQALIDAGVSPSVVDAAIAEADRRVVPVRPPRVLVVPGEPYLESLTRGDGWWECRIGDWCPSNKNLKKRWKDWHRSRKRDNAAVALWASHPNGPPPATGKRRLALRVERRRSNGCLPDPQNLEEAMFDALTINRMLVDDSGKWCEAERAVITINRALTCKTMTMVRLEDLR